MRQLRPRCLAKGTSTTITIRKQSIFTKTTTKGLRATNRKVFFPKSEAAARGGCALAVVGEENRRAAEQQSGRPRESLAGAARRRKAGGSGQTEGNKASFGEAAFDDGEDRWLDDLLSEPVHHQSSTEASTSREHRSSTAQQRTYPGRPSSAVDHYVAVVPLKRAESRLAGEETFRSSPAAADLSAAHRAVPVRSKRAALPALPVQLPAWSVSRSVCDERWQARPWWELTAGADRSRAASFSSLSSASSPEGHATASDTDEGEEGDGDYNAANQLDDSWLRRDDSPVMAGAGVAAVSDDFEAEVFDAIASGGLDGMDVYGSDLQGVADDLGLEVTDLGFTKAPLADERLPLLPYDVQPKAPPQLPPGGFIASSFVPFASAPQPVGGSFGVSSVRGPEAYDTIADDVVFDGTKPAFGSRSAAAPPLRAAEANEYAESRSARVGPSPDEVAEQRAHAASCRCSGLFCPRLRQARHKTNDRSPTFPGDGALAPLYKYHQSNLLFFAGNGDFPLYAVFDVCEHRASRAELLTAVEASVLERRPEPAVSLGFQTEKVFGRGAPQDGTCGSEADYGNSVTPLPMPNGEEYSDVDTEDYTVIGASWVSPTRIGVKLVFRKGSGANRTFVVRVRLATTTGVIDLASPRFNLCTKATKLLALGVPSEWTADDLRARFPGLGPQPGRQALRGKAGHDCGEVTVAGPVTVDAVMLQRQRVQVGEVSCACSGCSNAGSDPSDGVDESTAPQYCNSWGFLFETASRCVAFYSEFINAFMEAGIQLHCVPKRGTPCRPGAPRAAAKSAARGGAGAAPVAATRRSRRFDADAEAGCASWPAAAPKRSHNGCARSVGLSLPAQDAPVAKRGRFEVSSAAPGGEP